MNDQNEQAPIEQAQNERAQNEHGQQEITVRDNPEKSRFDIRVDGSPAGFSMYQDFGEAPTQQRIFYHTVVFDAFEGRGLAGVLTRAALDTSIQAGRRIVPVCPYVTRWLTTHHDFDDATDAAGPEHLRSLG